MTIFASLIFLAARALATPSEVVLTDFVSGTSASDYAPAFEGAIRALCPEPAGPCGGIVYVPSGTYPVGRTIDVPPGITLMGRGSAAVLVSTADQCSGAAPPSVAVRLQGARPGLQAASLESIIVTSDNAARMGPCSPYPGARPATFQSYDPLGKGAFNGCYDEEAKGRRFNPAKMNAVGILLDGRGQGGFVLRDVHACGLGVGVAMEDARGGFADLLVAQANNTGLRIVGSSDWTFENLLVHQNTLGIVLGPTERGESPRSIHVMGGLVQASHVTGVEVDSCVSCSLLGAHFEANGPVGEASGDVHISGKGPTQHFTFRGLLHSSWPSSLIENSREKGCPVDAIAFDDDVSTGWKNNLELRTDCPLRLRADRRLFLRRTAMESSGGVKVLDAGVPLSITVTGELGLGAPPGEAEVTVGAGGDTLHLLGSDARLRFIVDPRRAILARVSLDERGLELRGSGGAGLFVDAEGHVGVGTTTPKSALSVKGDLLGQSLTADGLRLASGTLPSCDASRRGVLSASGAKPQICVLTRTGYRWLAVGVQ